MNNIIIIVITMIINIMIMPKVLSYMEDHLKNKQRLEQEWVGLCAYEAEPNSTAIAFKVVSLSVLMLMLILSVSAPMRQSSYCVQGDVLVVVDVDVDVVVSSSASCDRWRTRRRTATRTSCRTITTGSSSTP